MLTASGLLQATPHADTSEQRHPCFILPAVVRGGKFCADDADQRSGNDGTGEEVRAERRATQNNQQWLGQATTVDGKTVQNVLRALALPSMLAYARHSKRFPWTPMFSPSHSLPERQHASPVPHCETPRQTTTIQQTNPTRTRGPNLPLSTSLSIPVAPWKAGAPRYDGQIPPPMSFVVLSWELDTRHTNQPSCDNGVHCTAGSSHGQGCPVMRQAH